MKNLLRLTVLAVVMLAAACEEKPFPIPEIKIDRRVLVEEVTGVNCPNCPDGTNALNDLTEVYGAENLIIVSIHAALSNFSVPLPESKYDFRFPEAYELANYIGAQEGYPSASFCRNIYPNQTSAFIVPPWEGFVADEFRKNYNLGIFVLNEYNPVTRELDIRVNIAPDETLTGDHRLTVVITQDSIIDAQNVHEVHVVDYVHRHVMRDVVSNFDGDAINEALSAGSLVSKTYKVTLPAGWDEKHCNVVAYVHRGGNPDKEVLQVAEGHVVE